MIESEKVLTWRPDGKKGNYILRKEYEVIRDFIFAILEDREITLNDLIEQADQQLLGKIEKDISWNVLVVKLDLEARGLITFIVRPVPQKLQVLKLKSRALKKYKAFDCPHEFSYR